MAFMPRYSFPLLGQRHEPLARLPWLHPRGCAGLEFGPMIEPATSLIYSVATADLVRLEIGIRLPRLGFGERGFLESAQSLRRSRASNSTTTPGSMKSVRSFESMHFSRRITRDRRSRHRLRRWNSPVIRWEH